MGGLNVLVLALLRAAAKQDNKRVSILSKIHAVAGAEVSPIFIHARADAFGIREITLLNADQTCSDLGRCRCVEAVKPFRKRAASFQIKILPDRYHEEW